MEKLIIANQKMYFKEEKEIKKYQKKLKKYKNKIIILPSFIYLKDFLKEKFICGAQDISAHEKGPYTAQISAGQIKNLGAKYALIGHSEVKKYYKETYEDINKKIKLSLQNDLKVILCIGETKEKNNMGKTKEVIKNQLSKALENINEKIIVSYEPVWTIGTGLPPTNDDIIEIVQYIKSLFDYKVKVLYGGSVDEKSIKRLNEINELDGYLIGGASTNYNQMIKIVEVVCK